MGYELLGRGSDLAIRVTGADIVACLATAVEGFAASVATVGDEAPRRPAPVEVHAESPAGLLVGLVDDLILRLDADGVLGVALAAATVDAGSVRGTLTTVALGDVQLHGVAPKAATWHEARLERSGDGWHGYVMVDL